MKYPVLYEKDNDKLFCQYKLKIDNGKSLAAFVEPYEDDSNYDMIYPLSLSQLTHLVKFLDNLTTVVIDMEKYEYFLESYSD